jgi:hypothetical protein
VNWSKSPEELVDSPTNPSRITSSNGDISSDSKTIKFMVDDVPMYLANECQDEYFVVF